MRVTVFGSAASWAGAGQACAGHYVEGGGARVLFDCGNGVLANLERYTDPLGLDAIFITHNHPDHYADLYCLNSLLRYAPQGPAAPLPLYLPDGLFERLQLLLSERGAREFREAFIPVALADGDPISIGDLTVTPCQVEHTDPTFALVARADGATFSYTADTAPGDHAIRCALHADLLFAEATLDSAYEGMAPHMSARQAAALAEQSGAGRLVLVHVWPGNDRERMLAEAREVFSGPVSVAREFETFDVVPIPKES